MGSGKLPEHSEEHDTPRSLKALWPQSTKTAVETFCRLVSVLCRRAGF